MFPHDGIEILPDGGVRLWNVFRQEWQEFDVSNIPDHLRATLTSQQRERLHQAAMRTMADDTSRDLRGDIVAAIRAEAATWASMGDSAFLRRALLDIAARIEGTYEPPE